MNSVHYKIVNRVRNQVWNNIRNTVYYQIFSPTSKIMFELGVQKFRDPILYKIRLDNEKRD